MVSLSYRPTMKELPEDTRPRERLLKEGAGALSEIELLAVLLSTGSREATALELASQMMAKFRSIHVLLDASVEELSEIKGVGPAKAAKVKAALELARRLSQFSMLPRPVIKSPDDAAGMSWRRCVILTGSISGHCCSIPETRSSGWIEYRWAR